MAPLLISGIVSLADTVMQNWHRAAEAKTAAQKPVDFEAVLKQTAANSLANAVTAPAQPLTAEALKLKLGGLSEVQGAFSGTLPGQPVTFAISSDGELSRVLPNGGRETIVLSSQSQAAVRQLAAAINPGGGFAVTLTAQQTSA